MTQRRGERFRVGDHVARVAVVVAAIGFAGIAIFQLALAIGAPWGHAVWAGANALGLTADEKTGEAEQHEIEPSAQGPGVRDWFGDQPKASTGTRGAAFDVYP